VKQALIERALKFNRPISTLKLCLNCNLLPILKTAGISFKLLLSLNSPIMVTTGKIVPAGDTVTGFRIKLIPPKMPPYLPVPKPR